MLHKSYEKGLMEVPFRADPGPLWTPYLPGKRTDVISKHPTEGAAIGDFVGNWGHPRIQQELRRNQTFIGVHRFSACLAGRPQV
jgi:hypothetical protein